jgi:hypothetical protein
MQAARSFRVASTDALSADTTVRIRLRIDASVKMGRRNSKDQANDWETS